MRLGAAVALVLPFMLAACRKEAPPAPESAAGSQAAASAPAAKGGKFYAPRVTDCGGFSTQDAAALLDVPADRIAAKSQTLYEGFWQCFFTVAGDSKKSIVFGVTVSKNAQEAEQDMAEYRSHLETAAGTAPFKDNAAKGAYSDISGVGDEAVWTDINTTLNARKGNVSIQVSEPSDKLTQIKVAEVFLGKL